MPTPSYSDLSNLTRPGEWNWRTGETGRVSGNYLTQITAVTFAGTSVPFTIASDLSLDFTVTSAARTGPLLLVYSSGTLDLGEQTVEFLGPWVSGSDTEMPLPFSPVDNAFQRRSEYRLIEYPWDAPDLDHPPGAGYGALGWITAGTDGIDPSDIASMAWTNGIGYSYQLQLALDADPDASYPNQPFFRYHSILEETYGFTPIDIPLPEVDTSDPTILLVEYEPPVLLGWRVTGTMEWASSWMVPGPDPTARAGQFPYNVPGSAYIGPPVFTPDPAAMPLLRWSNVVIDEEPHGTWTEFTPDTDDADQLNPDRAPYRGWHNQNGTLAEVIEIYAEVTPDEPVIFEVGPDVGSITVEVAPTSMDLDESNGRYMTLPDYNAYFTAYYDDSPFSVSQGYDSVAQPLFALELLYRVPRYQIHYSEPHVMTVPPLRQWPRDDGLRRNPGRTTATSRQGSLRRGPRGTYT